MQCPKCQSAMEDKTYGAKITIQRCTNCKGLFCK
ncbi:MAG: zf-TFIIB domain-containing protein, partial [Pseudomonadales bacterium]